MFFRLLTIFLFFYQTLSAQTQAPAIISTPSTAQIHYAIDPTTGNIKGFTKMPQFITTGEIKYPPAAYQEKIKGTVILEVDITSKGKINRIKVVEGLGHGCDEAAIAALKRSKFTPAYAGTSPVPIRMRLRYSFNIK